MKASGAARTPVRTKWSSLVAVCRECSGGKGLAKSLRRAAKDAGAGGIRVVSTSCLDVCPKRGVAVATMHAGMTSTAVIDASLAGDAALRVMPSAVGAQTKSARLVAGPSTLLGMTGECAAEGR